MILRYSFPQFEEQIPSGDKIHSFRKDAKKRWRAGLSIQHYMHSYMNPKSFKFWENSCMGVQDVRMMRVENGQHWILHNEPALQHRQVDELIFFIDGHLYVDDECHRIMSNDGLTKGQFIDFFLPRAVNGMGNKNMCWVADDLNKFDHGTWTGRLIHWTDTRY